MSEDDADEDADCTHFAIDPATGEKHFRTRTVPIEGPSFCHWEMLSDELREVRTQQTRPRLIARALSRVRARACSVWQLKAYNEHGKFFFDEFRVSPRANAVMISPSLTRGHDRRVRVRGRGAGVASMV